jgi:hypothetical protein
VALIQAVKEMVHQARENGDSMLACCAECLIGCIEALVEYFNKWAFVYVGLYGFSFMESGKNVMALFHSRYVMNFVVPRVSFLLESDRIVQLYIILACVFFWPRVVCSRQSVAREILRLTSCSVFLLIFPEDGPVSSPITCWIQSCSWSVWA